MTQTFHCGSHSPSATLRVCVCMCVQVCVVVVCVACLLLFILPLCSLWGFTNLSGSQHDLSILSSSLLSQCRVCSIYCSMYVGDSWRADVSVGQGARSESIWWHTAQSQGALEEKSSFPPLRSFGFA